MAEYLDNPAGRLHRTLVKFCQVANNNQSAWQAWSTVFDTAGDSIVETVRCVSLLAALPSEIEHELSQIDPDDYEPDLVLRWRSKLVQWLSPQTWSAQSAAAVGAQFDPLSLQSLEACSWTLHRFRRQRTFGDGDLERIGTLLAELEKELVNGSGVDAELRDFMLYHCMEMLRALRDMPICGPVALEDAFDKATGALYRRIDLTTHAAEASDSAWKKFVDVMKDIAIVIGVTASLAALPGEVRQAIEGPASPTQVHLTIESPQQAPRPGPPEEPSKNTQDRREIPAS